MNPDRSWEDYINGEITRIKMVGKSLIYPQHYQAWDELVVKQVNSLCILSIALEKMEALEKGKSFKEVDDMHNVPGSVDYYVRLVVALFSKKGPDYFEATSISEVSDEMQEYLNGIREENAQFQIEANGMQRGI